MRLPSILWELTRRAWGVTLPGHDARSQPDVPLRAIFHRRDRWGNLAHARFPERGPRFPRERGEKGERKMRALRRGNTVPSQPKLELIGRQIARQTRPTFRRGVAAEECESFHRRSTRGLNTDEVETNWIEPAATESETSIRYLSARVVVHFGVNYRHLEKNGIVGALGLGGICVSRSSGTSRPTPVLATENGGWTTVLRDR